MPYVVGTDPCSYLLSDDGICVRVTPAADAGPAPTAIVGAQFVASLDVTLPGGLSGGLEVGAAALFVKQDHAGRFVLLRTAAIRSVRERGALPMQKPELPGQKEGGEETTLTLERATIPGPPALPLNAAGAPPRPPFPPVPKGRLAPPIFELPTQARPTAPSVMPSPWDNPTAGPPSQDEARRSAKKKKR